MRKIILTLSAVLVFILTAVAQNRTITGKVTNEKGVGIPSTSVVIKGSKSGTTTDENGNYSISVPQAAKTLVFFIDRFCFTGS